MPSAPLLLLNSLTVTISGPLSLRPSSSLWRRARFLHRTAQQKTEHKHSQCPSPRWPDQITGRLARINQLSKHPVHLRVRVMHRVHLQSNRSRLSRLRRERKRGPYLQGGGHHVRVRGHAVLPLSVQFRKHLVGTTRIGKILADRILNPVPLLQWRPDLNALVREDSYPQRRKLGLKPQESTAANF